MNKYISLLLLEWQNTTIAKKVVEFVFRISSNRRDFVGIFFDRFLGRL